MRNEWNLKENERKFAEKYMGKFVLKNSILVISL